MQHGAVDPAENCAVGADAKPKHEHRCKGKAGALAKLPQCVTNVLDQSCHADTSSRNFAPGEWRVIALIGAPGTPKTARSISV